MGMATGPRGALAVQPNLTSFIDVLLVLLIIWLVAVMMTGTIDMQLAQEVGTAAGDDPIVLELPDSGGYLLNHRSIPPENLPGVLRRVYAEPRRSLLFVRAGGSRTYQETITAVDIARGAGVEVVAFAP